MKPLTTSHRRYPVMASRSKAHTQFMNRERSPQ